MSEPGITPRDSRVVNRLIDEIRKVLKPARPIVQWAASDARYLRREWFFRRGIQPGEIRCLHAIDEHVTTESLENAAKVYQGMLGRYAGEEKR